MRAPMKSSFFASLVVSLVVGGCASSTIAAPTDSGLTPTDASTDAGTETDAAAAADVVIPTGDKKTWTYIYAAYFGPASVGHCGNSGCHATPKGNFACASKDACYQSLVGRQLIGLEAALQPLVDPQATPLAWFANGNGSMPEDKPVANPTAATELTAWAAAGAPNN